MDVPKCDVCLGRFGERGRWPRVLCCGHTLCSLCVLGAIEGSAAVCPFCSSEHPASSPLDVPINHIVLRMLGSPASLLLPPEADAFLASSSPSSSPSFGACARRLASMPAFGASPGWCKHHGPERHFWCVTCQVWFCKGCALRRHQEASCSVIACDGRQALELFRQLEDEGVMKTILLFDQQVSLYRNQEDKLKGVVGRHKDHVRQLKEAIQKHQRLQRRLEAELAGLRLAISKGLEACVDLMGAQSDLFEAAPGQDLLPIRRRIWVGLKALQRWYNPSLCQDSEDMKASAKLQTATAECLLLLCSREIEGTSARRTDLPTGSPNSSTVEEEEEEKEGIKKIGEDQVDEKVGKVDGGPAKVESGATAVDVAAAAEVGLGAAAVDVGVAAVDVPAAEEGAAAVVAEAAAVEGAAAAVVEEGAAAAAAAVDSEAADDDYDEDGAAATDTGGDSINGGGVVRRGGRRVARALYR